MGLILLALFRAENKTRDDLIERTGIKWTPVYQNLEKLMKYELVKRTIINKHNRGKPRTYWNITPKGIKVAIYLLECPELKDKMVVYIVQRSVEK